MEIRRGLFMLDEADESFPAQGTPDRERCLGKLGQCPWVPVSQRNSTVSFPCGGVTRRQVRKRKRWRKAGDMASAGDRARQRSFSPSWID